MGIFNYKFSRHFGLHDLISFTPLDYCCALQGVCDLDSLEKTASDFRWVKLVFLRSQNRSSVLAWKLPEAPREREGE